MVQKHFDDTFDESLKTLALSTLAAGALIGGGSINAYNRLSPLEAIDNVLDSPATGAETNSDVGSSTYMGLSKSFIRAALQYIVPSEGVKYKPYKDSKGKWTVGIGHLVLPGEVFTTTLTPKEVLDLFVKDLKDHIVRAQKLTPQYDQYPQYIKLAILDGIYRGDLAQSPKTRQLISSGKWSDAAKEYTNNREYNQSKRLGDKHGVWKRMDRNAHMFKTFGNMLTKK